MPAPRFLGYQALLGEPKPINWQGVGQALWDSNLNAPIRGAYNLMNADPYTLYTDTGAAGQQAAMDSFDAAGGVTVGSAMVPTHANALRAGISPGMKTKGGKTIDPTETGWVFKDVIGKNQKMERHDFSRINSATDSKKWDVVELPIGEMYATQKSVESDFANPVSKNTDLPLVVKKNGAYLIQDGHHRLTKESMSGKQTARVRLIDLDGNRQTEFPLIDIQDFLKSGGI